MKLGPIIVQIQRECPSIKLVAGALSVDLQQKVSEGVLPAAYVVRLDETASPNEVGSNDYEQDIEEGFGVVIMLDNSKRDARGQFASDTLEDIRTELIRALVQWSPDDAHELIEYEGGSVLDIGRDRIAYSFEFRTGTTLTVEDTWRNVAYDRTGGFNLIHVDVDLEPPDGTPEAGFEVKLNGA